MLEAVLPGYCSSLRIFLSYSFEYRSLAESICQALLNRGHKVFFDRDSLPPASNFNERIRKAIHSSDRFLFLASRTALQKGKYTVTELEFARQTWPSPVGRVISVIVDPELKPEMLPPYLSSICAVTVSGNAPAEIAATFEKAKTINSACWSCLAVSTLLLAGMAGVFTGLIPVLPFFAAAEISIVSPEYVHFRPREQPPPDFGTPGADTFWTLSPVTVTLPIAYSSRNARSASAQLLGEGVELRIGDRTEKYTWTYVVEITGRLMADARCAGWLCQKANVKAQNLKPGETTETRETMFLPLSNTPLTWKELIDAVLEGENPVPTTVTIRAKIAAADGRQPDLTPEFVCVLDVAAARQRMLDLGYRPAQDPRPPTWQPRCRQT